MNEETANRAKDLLKLLGLPEDRIQRAMDKFAEMENPETRIKSAQIAQSAAIFQESTAFKEFAQRPVTMSVYMAIAEMMKKHLPVLEEHDILLSVFTAMIAAGTIVMWEDMPLEVPDAKLPNKS